MPTAEHVAAFSQLLRRTREQAEISQRELGRRVGVSSNAVSQYEAGKAIPTREHCEGLERELETEPGMLGRYLGYASGDLTEGLTAEALIQADQTLDPGVKAVVLAALAEGRRQSHTGD